MNLSDSMILSTIRVVTNKSTGTGFFFTFSEDQNGRFIPAIVTNRHVVQGTDVGQLTFTIEQTNKDDFTVHETVHINSLQSFIMYHPDPNVDLAIILLSTIINNLQQQGKVPLIVYLNKDNIPKEHEIRNLFAIEDVIVIGYPNGLWDTTNNLPIIRKGITATDIRKNFCNEAKFLIDCAIYPGSSGSPVFVYNQGSYATEKGTVIGSRAIFVGVNAEVYTNPSLGQVLPQQIQTENNGVMVRVPNNLGVIIKSHKVLDFEEILKKY